MLVAKRVWDRRFLAARPPAESSGQDRSLELARCPGQPRVRATVLGFRKLDSNASRYAPVTSSESRRVRRKCPSVKTAVRPTVARTTVLTAEMSQPLLRSRSTASPATKLLATPATREARPDSTATKFLPSLIFAAI